MPQSDNVVVIGGAGFIGRHLTQMLLDQGNSVVVVSRSAGAKRSTHPRLSFRSAGVANREEISAAIRGATVVYDLSMGNGPTWEEHKREVVDSAVHIARACKEYGVRRLLYTSSTAALYLGGRRTVTEAEGPDAKPESRSFYSRGKIEAELALLRLHASEKLPVVIFRPAIVLGPGGMLVHGAFGEPPRASDTCILGTGSGNTPLPCVLVDDVARALLLAKDAPAIEGLTFNLAGDVRPSVQQYVAWMREATRRNFRYYPRPVWWIQAGELARWGLKTLARKSNTTLGSLRDIASSTMSAQLDCSLAKQKLGWKPVANEQEFRRQALLCHVVPLHPGDVRLEPVRQ